MDVIASPRFDRICSGIAGHESPIVVAVALLQTIMTEMFNRYAIGVRAHADGVGVKPASTSSSILWNSEGHVFNVP
jgi:hypothetical protein